MASPAIPAQHLDFITKPVPDADRPRLRALSGQPFQPVFIMGLHRSGTTFLYECLSRILPAASLTVYDILFFPRLLTAFEEGTAEAERASLDAYFRDLGLDTRLIDDMALSSGTLEEYGYVLEGARGMLQFNGWTRPAFETLCRKLARIAGRELVLLKNPWDLRRAAALHKAYPEARFIYIRRSPVDILNSQLKASQLVSGVNPYTRLLGKTRTVKQRLNAWVGRWLARRSEATRTRWFLGLCRRFVTAELGAYRRGQAALPPRLRHEVAYEDLVRDPQGTLRGVCAFLGEEPGPALADIAPRPRNLRLLPEVEACREAFERGLDPSSLAP